MGGNVVSKEADFEPAEAVLLDVVRMIVRDQSDEVPARLHKLVSTQAGRRQAKLSEPARAAIALLLTEDPAARKRVPRGRGLRSTAVAAARAGSGEVDAAQAPRPVLSAADEAATEGILREYRERDRLFASGLRPTRTVLLSGPPGVGKSMTMQYLAGQVDRPLIRVEPADVIGSFLGESARSLAATFREARERGAVLALDEIDALAKRRDDLHDVGEFKRFVTTLLVELDRWPGDAPLLAATNHLELLDPALHRRFEVHIRLGPPDAHGRKQLLAAGLSKLGMSSTDGTLEAVVAVTVGATGADLAGLVQRAARRAVLDAEPLDRALLIAVLPADVPKLDRHTRAKFAAAARDQAGMSTRAIGELLNCSHTAARRLAQDGAEVFAAERSE